jgi:uncharacterized protein (DUF433 family)
MNPRFEFITQNVEILGGKPILKGTRISVEFILELIQHGASIETILEHYSHLKREAVEQAVEFAIWSVRTETPFAFAA